MEKKREWEIEEEIKRRVNLETSSVEIKNSPKKLGWQGKEIEEVLHMQTDMLWTQARIENQFLCLQGLVIAGYPPPSRRRFNVEFPNSENNPLTKPPYH